MQLSKSVRRSPITCTTISTYEVRPPCSRAISFSIVLIVITVYLCTIHVPVLHMSACPEIAPYHPHEAGPRDTAGFLWSSEEVFGARNAACGMFLTHGISHFSFTTNTNRPSHDSEHKAPSQRVQHVSSYSFVPLAHTWRNRV